MRITLNEKPVEVADATTVEALLQAQGYPDRGIAVAIDHTVLPRCDWGTALTAGARVDVLAAVQGG